MDAAQHVTELGATFGLPKRRRRALVTISIPPCLFRVMVLLDIYRDDVQDGNRRRTMEERGMPLREHAEEPMPLAAMQRVSALRCSPQRKYNAGCSTD